jgi:hypothetical protein
MEKCCNCDKLCEESFDKCHKCKKSFCDDCISWDEIYRSLYGGLRHKGHIVVFDNRGRGQRYGYACYKSIIP